jgi:CHAT domain-containing protein
MRPRTRGDGAAALAACALLMLASSLEAQPAAPADPAAVVRELFVRYTAGDLRGASSLWVSGAPREDFVRRHRARVEKRCLRLASLTIDAVPANPGVFDVTSTMTLRAAAPGSPEWWESSRSRISLQRDGEEWRIAAWEPRERELVEGLVAAAGAAERASLLESSAELQTTTFVRLAAQRGMDLLNRGRHGEAAMLTSAALTVAEHLGDPAAIAAALSARSSVLRLQNDLEASHSTAGQAVILAEGGGDPDVLAFALVRLARTQERRKGIPDPDLLERALGFAGDLEDVAIAAHAAVHLGRSYELRSEYREAFRLAHRAFRLAEQSGDRAARFSAALLLCGAFGWIREDRLMHRYGVRAAELAAEGGYDAPAATIVAGRVRQLANVGDFAGALSTTDEALGNVRTSAATAILLEARAAVYHASGRFDEADGDLDRFVSLQPLDLSSKQRIAMGRASIAWTRGDYEAALVHLSAARGPDLNFDRAARHHRADILNRYGHVDEARAVIEELLGDTSAAPPLNDPQRSLFHETWHVSERLLVELLVAQGDSAAALRTAERVKGKELALVLSHGAQPPAAGSRQEPRERAIEEQIRELNRRLVGNNLAGAAAAAVREQLGAAREDLLELRQRLYSEGPAAPALRSAEVCIDDLPAELDDATIVNYVISEERTIVFVLEPKRDGRREVHARSIEIKTVDLYARIESLAALVEQRNLRAPAVAAGMYDLLIGPIESFVREARSLCIIPDGHLWRVPFQVLGPDGGSLLVDRLPLFYAPSVTVLATVRPSPGSRDGKPRLLAFANPAVGAETASLYRAFDPDAPLGAIPETESEVRAIGRIYGPEASRIYVGKTARETTLKEEAPDYDVLHIATHGMVHESAPMFSALLLTASPEDESDDGVLEAREIATLALTADLTVLSACETGRANLNGSGVIGLSWAFLAAGCRTTVVSQWKAHSAASAALMIEFHRQLARGRSRPEALRRAQLALRRDPRYRHPFYWAPFMVIGRP